MCLALTVNDKLPGWKRRQLTQAINALNRVDIYTTTRLTEGVVRTGRSVLRKGHRRGPVIRGIGHRGIEAIQEEFNISIPRA